MDRFLELDAFRGLLVFLMIGYHFLFDVDFLVAEIINFQSEAWFWFARSIAFFFVLLVGVSLSLHSFRKGLNPFNEKIIQIKKGIFVLGIGFGITIVTQLFFPGYTIWFGILHFIGIGIIFSIPFVKKPIVSLFLGLGIIILGSVFYSFLLSFKIMALFPFSFKTFDYFPLFPWFGVLLVGIFLGGFLYPLGKRRFSFPFEKNNSLNCLAFVGKNSLLIYLIHQPILVLIVSILFGKWVI